MIPTKEAQLPMMYSTPTTISQAFVVAVLLRLFTTSPHTRPRNVVLAQRDGLQKRTALHDAVVVVTHRTQAQHVAKILAQILLWLIGLPQMREVGLQRSTILFLAVN